MIRDLTAKEEEFLVKYCMEPENIWLALAIGQIQPVLRKKIVCFLEELDTNVRKKLEEYDPSTSNKRLRDSSREPSKVLTF